MELLVLCAQFSSVGGHALVCLVLQILYCPTPQQVECPSPLFCLRLEEWFWRQSLGILVKVESEAQKTGIAC